MDSNKISLAKGKYAIGVQTLKKDVDEPSAMANYLSQVAVVTNEADIFALSLLLQSQTTITGFQVQNNQGEFIEAMETQIDEEMDRRYEMFKLDFLPKSLNARVQYEVDHEGQVFHGDEILRLAFNEERLEKLPETK